MKSKSPKKILLLSEILSGRVRPGNVVEVDGIRQEDVDSIRPADADNLKRLVDYLGGWQAVEPLDLKILIFAKKDGDGKRAIGGIFAEGALNSISSPIPRSLRDLIDKMDSLLVTKRSNPDPRTRKINYSHEATTEIFTRLSEIYGARVPVLALPPELTPVAAPPAPVEIPVVVAAAPEPVVRAPVEIGSLEPATLPAQGLSAVAAARKILATLHPQSPPVSPPDPPPIAKPVSTPAPQVASDVTIHRPPVQPPSQLHAEALADPGSDTRRDLGVHKACQKIVGGLPGSGLAPALLASIGRRTKRPAKPALPDTIMSAKQKLASYFTDGEGKPVTTVVMAICNSSGVNYSYVSRLIGNSPELPPVMFPETLRKYGEAFAAYLRDVLGKSRGETDTFIRDLAAFNDLVAAEKAKPKTKHGKA